MRSVGVSTHGARTPLQPIPFFDACLRAGGTFFPGKVGEGGEELAAGHPAANEGGARAWAVGGKQVGRIRKSQHGEALPSNTDSSFLKKSGIKRSIISNFTRNMKKKNTFFNSEIKLGRCLLEVGLLHYQV